MDKLNDTYSINNIEDVNDDGAIDSTESNIDVAN